MAIFNRKTVFYGISIVVFLTYLLYLQSDTTTIFEGLNCNSNANDKPTDPIVVPEANNKVVKEDYKLKEALPHNSKSEANGVSRQKVLTNDQLKLSIELENFQKIMSMNLRNLISKDTNPKIFEYIDFKYQDCHFDDFSQMSEQFRMLQKFWIVNRKLISLGVTNSSRILSSQDKIFLKYELDHDSELKYTNDLKKFYYLMNRLEQKLVGWIHPYHPDLSSLYDTFTPNSKAIVIPIGNHYMSMGTTVVSAIRNIHKVDIPIHVYYIGESDLSYENRGILENLASNVYTHDITKFLDNRIIDLAGWALRPFAALLAPAQHVMLIDADITFLQSPEVFFDHPNYKDKKSLFFWDRSMWRNDEAHAEWVLSFAMNDADYKKLHTDYNAEAVQAVPRKFGKYVVPERLKDSRYLTLKAAHEQESGVVLIDKLERFIPLLAACSMNSKFERNTITYRKVHGDKETYWMGYEMVGGQYAWNPHPPGMISDGTIKPDTNNFNLSNPSHDYKWKGTNEICSTQILHFDHNNKPYWLNGGLYANRFYKKWGLHNFSHYLQGSDATWKLGLSNWVCLTSASAKVQELDKQNFNIIEETKKIFNKLKQQHGFDRS